MLCSPPLPTLGNASTETSTTEPASAVTSITVAMASSNASCSNHISNRISGVHSNPTILAPNMDFAAFVCSFVSQHTHSEIIPADLLSFIRHILATTQVSSSIIVMALGLIMKILA
ncbi:hypothetical protein HK100_008588, partial [Physocladia obscura]